MHAFFDAVHVFFHHLANVEWKYLALAIVFHFGRLAFRALAWRTILSASFPGERVRYRSVFGAYLVGVGINSVAPARAGDVARLLLTKRRIPNASYATLAPTLLTETLLDFFLAGGILIWALSIGVLPTHDVYSRLPAVDWGFFVRNEQATAIGILALLAVLTIAFIVFLEKGGDTRDRLVRGFAILGRPRRFVAGVALPQAVSWVLRVTTAYYFLQAFQVTATIHNALLVLTVDSLATLFPATPGGAGTKQGLIVFLFRGQAVSKSALLAFSVGVNIAVVVANILAGGIALWLMARTLSWKRLRAAEEPAT